RREVEAEVGHQRLVVQRHRVDERGGQPPELQEPAADRGVMAAERLQLHGGRLAPALHGLVEQRPVRVAQAEAERELATSCRRPVANAAPLSPPVRSASVLAAAATREVWLQRVRRQRRAPGPLPSSAPHTERPSTRSRTRAKPRSVVACWMLVTRVRIEKKALLARRSSRAVSD